jgi:hypothetical protein
VNGVYYQLWLILHDLVGAFVGQCADFQLLQAKRARQPGDTRADHHYFAYVRHSM